MHHSGHLHLCVPVFSGHTSQVDGVMTLWLGRLGPSFELVLTPLNTGETG